MTVMRKQVIKFASLMTILIVSGCGYSDYPGHPGHKTQNEAYVPAWSTVISGFGDEYDGTYVYSVKYNNRNWQKSNYQFNVEIKSYRNKVGSSYPHRPNVFPDADGFDRATGFAGGTYYPYWTATDQDANIDGGLANFDQTHPLDEDGNWIEPGLILVANAPEQEVDSVDWDLQSSVKSAGELLNSLISNKGKLNNLSFSIKNIELDGAVYPAGGFQFEVSTQTGGFNQFKIVNQPATAQLIKSILDNTQDLKKVELKLHLENGMVVGLPKDLSVRFNHKVLRKLGQL
ncbi:hypothetical protein [Aliikangiella sp. G2MR2-5]|uniref:hypothetical protein n=1 Tax=Aliikangiella sp. G2MR2-5 TaxID=2788943 RepID=UPI0018A9EFA8|nr:hypothetical protein [Aliikangiella sp. G2MR2-5]